MSELKECRCSKCKRLLAKVDGRAEIVCPRCSELNLIDVSRGESLDDHDHKSD